MQESDYYTATEIEIRACEWAEGPDTWDVPWTDEVSYGISLQELEEADRLFAERDLEEWVGAMSDRDFTDLIQCVERLKELLVAYDAPISVPRLLSWIEI